MTIGRKYEIRRKFKNGNLNENKRTRYIATLEHEEEHYYVFRVDGKLGSYNITFTKVEERIGEIVIKPR